MGEDYRTEKDALGTVRVPADRLWGAQTERSRENFPIGVERYRWGRPVVRALGVLKLMGAKTVNLVLGFMIATGFISMWVSNTATAVMMLPVGLSVITVIAQFRNGRTDANFATALMLAMNDRHEDAARIVGARP